MLELQRIRFAGWALTEGQHRPKAGKKKKSREAGLFFLVPASSRCSIRKWVNPALPIVVLTVLTHPIKFFPRFQWGPGKNFIERSRTIERSRSFSNLLQQNISKFHAVQRRRAHIDRQGRVEQRACRVDRQIVVAGS